MTIKQLQLENALLERALGLACDTMKGGYDKCPLWKPVGGCRECGGGALSPVCHNQRIAHFIKQAQAKGRKS